MIKLVITGLNAFQKKIERVKKNIQSKELYFRQIGVLLLNEVSKNFKSESHEGKAWTPLSPMTLATRRKGKGAGRARILQDTGTLRRSFVPKSTNHGVWIGSPIPYSIKHEKGIGVPQRKMLPSNELALKIARNIIKEHIAISVRQK